MVNDNGKRPTDSSDANSKKRIKTRSLFRQPTVSELNRLHETENLFNSNLFRLQVEEVLQEVKVKEKLLTKFEIWFENFKNSLLSIPENCNEYNLIEKTLFKELKVKLPVGGDINRSKCNFKFQKFSDIQIIGSYALGCALNSKLCIDVQIVVPADTYTKNDSINYKYHKKRATYLAYIASYLRKNESIEDLQYSWLNGNESKPFILLKPKGKLGNNLTVRIILSCDPEAYKLHRYSLDRNNLRESWFLSSENTEENSDVGPPTPYYNSSILHDLTNSANHQFLQDLLEHSENLKQAVVLIKIWLRQRCLQVSGFIVSMFVAYLVQMKRINNIMSSYQIVRNVWISLKTSEWDVKGISAYKGTGSTPSTEEFLKHFQVVFLDTTGYFNICWQMNIDTYLALRRESAMAVDMLDNPNINSFIPLFMTPFKTILQFDHILRFKDITKIRESVSKNACIEDKLNYGVDNLALVTKTLHSVLSKGLGQRVDLILQYVEADYSWQVKQNIDKARECYEEELSFGLVLNAEHAMSTVDKGPPANLPDAELFRKFWGDKSELRRFQDGSITETCVWNADSLAERRMVTKQVIEYLLKTKFGISSDIYYVADQLDSVLTCKQYASSDGCVGTGEEATVRVLQAFDELRRNLRSLTDMPLDVNSVYGISPVFSYTDPYPPQAKGLGAMNPWKRGSSCLIKERTRDDDLFKCPQYTPVSTAILELGHSGKWPGDLQAFRCLKAAFHLQIAESLTRQFSVPSQPHATHIDVLKSGLVFRLEIAHPKEITLIKREVEGGVVKHKENEDSSNLQCRTVLLPRLRGAMHGLHQKHPAYGPTVALTKRWLSSHLIDDNHFPHIVVELLVASVFIRPEPLSAPAQPLCAFLRILNLLCSRDWTCEPLVVNFNDELNREELLELEKKHTEKDSEMPSMFIITPYDGETVSVWSKCAPTVNILGRVQILAKSTFGYLEESLLKESRNNVLGIFIPSLAGYDVIIHLHPHLVPYSGERVEKKPIWKPLPAIDEVEPLIPVVEFNPVKRYLEELRCAYSAFALFFHDMYGGDVIAVLWKPDVKENKDFQITNAHALKPTKLNGEVNHEVNLEAIVEDFRIIGEGLVEHITVN